MNAKVRRTGAAAARRAHTAPVCVWETRQRLLGLARLGYPLGRGHLRPLLQQLALQVVHLVAQHLRAATNRLRRFASCRLVVCQVSRRPVVCQVSRRHVVRDAIFSV